MGKLFTPVQISLSDNPKTKIWEENWRGLSYPEADEGGTGCKHRRRKMRTRRRNMEEEDNKEGGGIQ